jgi:hypothetical protein
MPARAVQITQFRGHHERAGHTEPITPDGDYTGLLGFPRLQLKHDLLAGKLLGAATALRERAAGPVLGAATAMRGTAFGRQSGSTSTGR